jgi:hypothetical protein
MARDTLNRWSARPLAIWLPRNARSLLMDAVSVARRYTADKRPFFDGRRSVATR